MLYKKKKHSAENTVNKGNRKIFFSASMVFIWICFLYPGIIGDITATYRNNETFILLTYTHLRPWFHFPSTFSSHFGIWEIYLFCLSVYHITYLCVFFQQKVTNEHRSPIPLYPLNLDTFFQHRLAKYLPCAITELPPTLQRSHVEVRIPIFIALGLKSLCRSN